MRAAACRCIPCFWTYKPAVPAAVQEEEEKRLGGEFRVDDDDDVITSVYSDIINVGEADA